MGNPKSKRSKKGAAAEAVAEPINGNAEDPKPGAPWFLRLQGTPEEIDMAMDDWRQYMQAGLSAGMAATVAAEVADKAMHEQLKRRALLEAAPELEGEPMQQGAGDGAAVPAS